MMHVYNRMLHLFSALMISFGVSAQSDLVITGVMDGPLSGGTPKVLELYVMSDVADASAYKVYRYSNGGSSAYTVYTFPAIALTAGQHYTIASDSAKYYAFFGSNADGFGSLSINGDDIVELRMGSDTVDVFGQYGVDGTGQCWDHLDGWAYRNNGVSPTASFDCNEWTFSGTNALDGQTTNAGAPTPFPSATYTGASAPSFTTYTVTNSGPVFTPESLAIELGDSVHWSISGNHNVNGSLGTFPNNPEGFYSGPAPITSFGHRFTISGAYDYQCDPHAGIGQTGYIEVQGPLNPVSNLTMASNGEDEVNVSWTQPAGAHGVDWDGVAVFMSESPFSNFFTNNAQELSNYTGNFSYTGGSSVSADGSNSGYCIYNSTNNSGGNIDIDGLNAGTTYYIAAYAYRTVAASDDDVSSEEAASVTTDSPVINSDLIITGIMDGPLSGGTPKALEIYAMNDVSDISSYTVQYASNGKATYAVAGQLPAVSMNAGDFYYLTTDSAQFYAYLGFDADQVNSGWPNGLYINGDDHVALFKGSYPVDYFGVYQVDGTGECWDHLDGWAYRNNNSSPTTAFDCAEWTFSGTNALDGTSTNASAPNPWPVGTYGIVAAVDLEVTEIMSNSAHSIANSDGDWFEIRNNGSTSVNLNGYSWDNSSQTAGTHTFGNYVLAAGQSLIVLDEDSSSIQAWSNIWGQTANSIRVIARDMIGLTGFDDFSNAGDGVYLYDASGALIESAVFTVGNTGNSVEFSNGTPTQSVAGVNGAYNSTDGDVGSPGDMTPVYVTVPTYSISQVRSVDANGVADSLNTYCKLSGTVTSIDFDGNSGYSFYMTDGTQGINVYRSSDLSNYTSPAMGDNIEVIGTIAQFRGLLEIIPDSLTLVSQNNTVPAPMIVTTLDESTESELITFENVTLVDTANWPTSATSRSIDFITSGGDTLTMRIDYDAAIFGNTPMGSFDLTGIGGQFDVSSPYLEGYQIFPRDSSDISLNTATCADRIDSVQAINLSAGVFRAHINGPLPTATNYTVEWKPDTASTWRSRTFNKANQPYMNINITPWYNNTIAVRIGVNDGGTVSYSCEETFTTPCRVMTLQTAEQNAAKCPGDSALVRVGYAGGRGPKTILWSNGATTKRTYADQGETLTVTVTDATGCSLTDSITAGVLANTSVAPSNVSTTRSGTVVTVNWTASTFGSGQSLIGYRVQYRLRGSTTWSSTSLTPNTTADVDFAGGTAGNYDFTVIARYNDNGSGTTSARACFTVRGVPTTKRGASSGMDNGSAIAIYPNPAHNQVYVAAANGSEVSLMDLGGRILAMQTVDQAEVAFNLSGMANGIYMIQIRSNGEVITERVVKQ
jgi:plastocyanin